MRRPPKLPLQKLLSFVDSKESAVIRRVYDDYRETIEHLPGSSTKHQTWEGGYLSHIEETMNIVKVLYESLSSCRPVGFSLSDALFCAFLHDFDKVQRYTVKNGKVVKSGPYSSDLVHKTIAIVRDRYMYTMTDEQVNALIYAHGEGADYHSTDRVMLPLATIVHCADIISARVWFDNGKSHDKWED
jgi:hypothetical protein